MFNGTNLLESTSDEFCFRLNRSQFKDSIFDKVIHRMVIQKPFSFQMIRCT